tara:strand:+ start:405 stop:1040 length:636 start_codon:yes stop_codon:yes gene_type:complete
MSILTDYYIEDFIGVFDTEFQCQEMIDFFKYCEETDASFDRGGFIYKGIKDPATREDRVLPLDYFLDQERPNPPSSYMFNKKLNSKYIKMYNQCINECLNLYGKKYEILINYDMQSVYLNVQKTEAGQGYHKWHCENTGEGTIQRVLATMIYLNDDFEGGETEFLYLKKRMKPVKGRVLIFPAAFTHTHRGGLVLDGTKYIATAWVESKRI